MAKAKLPASPANFETALQELESIVRGMESGDAPLEESLAAYERGLLLLKFCRDTLDSAERKLQILEGNALGDLLDDDLPES